MKKQNIAIIGVIALVLAVAIGYALFSETLTITGTATAKGDFNIEFTSVGEITKVGYTDQTSQEGANIAVIEEGNNKLTVTVDKLDYPGAYVEIPVTITNKGSVPAKLKNIKETGLTEESRAIKVTYSGIAASESVINQNDTQSMTIKVEWDPEVNTTVDDVEFTIELEYEQIKA